MNTLEAWTAQVCQALGLDPGAVDRDLLLDLTKDVARGVARPAAPLTSFLVGLAAGRDGGSEQDVRSACEQVAALVARWPDGRETWPNGKDQRPGGEDDDPR
ncbi:MAG: DUF6457 domain-containing protein [Pseudonocardiaceae bacterium]